MSSATRDIASRADIERLVNGFYERVRGDELLGPIFDDVAQTDWALHLPKMYDFWEGVLFGVAGFRGNRCPSIVNSPAACHWATGSLGGSSTCFTRAWTPSSAVRAPKAPRRARYGLPR